MSGESGLRAVHRLDGANPIGGGAAVYFAGVLDMLPVAEPTQRGLDGNGAVIIQRLYKSPNSALAKARTQYMNKQRMMLQDRKTGHYAVGCEEE